MEIARIKFYGFMPAHLNKKNWDFNGHHSQPAWSIGLHFAELTKIVGGIPTRMYTKIFIFLYLLFNIPLVEQLELCEKTTTC